MDRSVFPSFNEDNLPDEYLPAPFAPNRGKHEKTWNRNWTLFYITRYWTSQFEGKNSVLREWVAVVEDRDDAPSRQVIHAAIKRMRVNAMRKHRVNWAGYHEKIKEQLPSDYT